ncbi:pleckstrin homology domain-containing family A member 3-like isoform X3 [Callorhinchus milii]|uniref:pleckstrin homology domain-containing family A member 3-like isoform X3 n=1 Tax=Callorhinchus milii TaxID=7868 RepID=UPI001C3FF0A3|nr:pleckstrin homology domain-containing family A member 3-like isoform X3 [Callorhinchus milii]
MEGVLHKWTNYLSGWQPRYFVLHGTIFSYYDSQEDVGKGSKGSIKMAVCEIKDISENDDCLKSKMSELRLYCDLLMQQVHKIQESAHPMECGSTPDVEKMNEASSLLKATCNTFINTLEDCMKIASVKIAPELLTPPESTVVHVTSTPLRRVRRSVSHTGVAPDRNAELNQEQKGSVTVMRNLEQMAAHRATRWLRQTEENERADAVRETEPANPTQNAQKVKD